MFERINFNRLQFSCFIQSKCSSCDVTQENRFFQISALHLAAYERIIKKRKDKGKGENFFDNWSHDVYLGNKGIQALVLWLVEHESLLNAVLTFNESTVRCIILRIYYATHTSSFRPQVMEKVGKISTISRPSSTRTLRIPYYNTELNHI